MVSKFAWLFSFRVCLLKKTFNLFSMPLMFLCGLSAYFILIGFTCSIGIDSIICCGIKSFLLGLKQFERWYISHQETQQFLPGCAWWDCNIHDQFYRLTKNLFLMWYYYFLITCKLNLFELYFPIKNTISWYSQTFALALKLDGWFIPMWGIQFLSWNSFIKCPSSPW